jgi:hypothetical protein
VNEGREHRPCFILTLWILCSPAIGLAASNNPAVTVMGVSGQATVTRATTPHPTSSLTFRDSLFPGDRIVTKEKSAVRVLFGGKALLTVRESTDLSVGSELQQRMVVDLASGAMALAVAKGMMKAGEGFEVRTPNAVATVRGTVILVEAGLPVSATTGSRAASASTGVTTFHVVSGRIHVLSLATPKASPVSVGGGLSVTVTGTSVGKPYASPPLPDVNSLMTNPQHVQSPDEVKKAMRGKQVTGAEALTEAMALELAGGEEGGKKKKGKSKAKAVDPVLLDSSKGAEVIMKAPPKAKDQKLQDLKLEDPRENVIIPTTKAPSGK